MMVYQNTDYEISFTTIGSYFRTFGLVERGPISKPLLFKNSCPLVPPTQSVVSTPVHGVLTNSKKCL